MLREKEPLVHTVDLVGGDTPHSKISTYCENFPFFESGWSLLNTAITFAAFTLFAMATTEENTGKRVGEIFGGIGLLFTMCCCLCSFGRTAALSHHGEKPFDLFIAPMLALLAGIFTGVGIMTTENSAFTYVGMSLAALDLLCHLIYDFCFRTPHFSVTASDCEVPFCP